MEDRNLDPTDLDYRKKVQREAVFESNDEMFPNVMFGIPAYSYERPEIFVEFDTSDDPDYLGRAYIRWSAIQWLGKEITHSDEGTFHLSNCDLCTELGKCIKCNACEFDLNPFDFDGPCRFQEREKRVVCEDCYEKIEGLVHNLMEKHPEYFVARSV